MDERYSSPSATGRTESTEEPGIADKVRERAAAQLNTQKDRATDGIGSVAKVARETTQHLRERQHETIAGYVEQAADQLDRFSRNLKNKDVRELVEDAQRLARRQPALFVGGAFALGLAGARFFKSSASHERYDYDRGGYGATYGRENYRGAAGSSEYGRPDWRSPGVDTGSGISGTMTGAAGAGYTGAGTSGSSAVGSSTRNPSTKPDAAGRSTASGKRSGSEGSTRSRTNTDTER